MSDGFGHSRGPNPSLKRSANGSPPGPVGGAGAFSTARAWRATVVSRLAHTLGLACPPSQARHHSLKFNSARSAGQVLSWLSVSIAQSPAPKREANTLFSQRSTFLGMPRGPASRSFLAQACSAPFFPGGATLVGFLIRRHTLPGGQPPPNGARPNPSLKRSANGSPPGPVRGAVAFSTARAWRATVVSRLAHTLGRTNTPTATCPAFEYASRPCSP